mmetsp:Transcript_17268/g.44680  ORF Transcript_17268/g.44680 Transcript_17268/m.44680 type:complete len:215 (-) Transcript_17268:36-680(-)
MAVFRSASAFLPSGDELSSACADFSAACTRVATAGLRSPGCNASDWKSARTCAASVYSMSPPFSALRLTDSFAPCATKACASRSGVLRSTSPMAQYDLLSLRLQSAAGLSSMVYSHSGSKTPGVGQSRSCTSTGAMLSTSGCCSPCVATYCAAKSASGRSAGPQHSVCGQSDRQSATCIKHFTTKPACSLAGAGSSCCSCSSMNARPTLIAEIQ